MPLLLLFVLQHAQPVGAHGADTTAAVRATPHSAAVARVVAAGCGWGVGGVEGGVGGFGVVEVASVSPFALHSLALEGRSMHERVRAQHTCL